MSFFFQTNLFLWKIIDSAMNKKSDQAVLKFEVAEIVKLSVNSTGKKTILFKEMIGMCY